MSRPQTLLPPGHGARTRPAGTRRVVGHPRGFSKLVQPLVGREVPPGILVASLLVLSLATDVKLRVRDTDLAVAGVLDLQILVEVAIWGVVGLWLSWHLGLRDLGRRPWERLSGGLTLPRDNALRALLAAVALMLVGSLYAPTSISGVRAGQWAILAAWAVLAWRQVDGNPLRLAALWIWLRRLLVGSALLASALSAVFNFEPLVSVARQLVRYRWFEMHPITTANGLGVAIIALAGTMLGLPDPLFTSRRNRVLRIAVLVGLGGLLALTRERGALLATVSGLLVLAAWSPYARRRAATLLAALSAAAALVAGIGQVALQQFLARGQTVEELRQFSGRGEIFAHAWTLILDRPLFGHGYLSGRVLFLDVIRWGPGESHNVFVEIALSFGLLGVAVFGVLLGTLIVRLAREMRGPVASTRMLAREAAVAGVFLLVSGMVAEGFITPGYEGTLLIWIVVVCACAAGLRRSALPARLH